MIDTITSHPRVGTYIYVVVVVVFVRALTVIVMFPTDNCEEG